MRFLIFLGGLSILALGGAAVRVLEKAQGVGFLTGALTLGGGLIISGLFALRWRWHGVIAAGVLSLLGFARGLGNFPGVLNYFSEDVEKGKLPVLESAVAIICLLLLIAVVRTIFSERHRRLLETTEEDGSGI